MGVIFTCGHETVIRNINVFVIMAKAILSSFIVIYCKTRE